jgi:prepilin-type N-terminal cleavage/methylation domain-containing protein
VFFLETTMIAGRRAFSLVELIIVVAILGVMAFIAVPRLHASLAIFYKAGTFSQKFMTDLRLTRSTAISSGATNSAGFALQMTGSSPYTGYCIKNLLTNAVTATYSIDPQIRCTGGMNFKFGPLGNLLSGSDTQLTMTAAGKTTIITVVAATGTITFSEN